MQIKNIKMVFLRVPSSAKEKKFNTVLCVSAYLCIFLKKSQPKAVSTGKNFLTPYPFFVLIKLGTIGVLVRYFYSPKDL